jgi:hypothetical protein
MTFSPPVATRNGSRREKKSKGIGGEHRRARAGCPIGLRQAATAVSVMDVPSGPGHRAVFAGPSASRRASRW